MELTFNRFIKMLLDKLWLLILMIVISGLAAYLISSFLISPKYQSQASFMIAKENEDGTSDASGAKAIKSEYIAYTQSDNFLKEINDSLKNETGIDVKLTELKNYISVGESTTKSSTEFIITVTAYDYNTAFQIANQIAEKGPDIYKAFGNNSTSPLKDSEAILVNVPVVNDKPVSPNTPLNIVLGVFLGIIFGILLILSIESIDNSIKDENDLIDNYEVPLLGVIYSHRTEIPEKTK